LIVLRCVQRLDVSVDRTTRVDGCNAGADGFDGIQRRRLVAAVHRESSASEQSASGIKK
jgi:hypothetical protein